MIKLGAVEREFQNLHASHQNINTHMNIRPNILSAATLVAALSLGGLTAQAQNLLSDPGFESGGVGSPWSTFGAVSYSQTFAHSGSWSLENNGTGNFTVPGAFETFATTAGAMYDFTGFALTPTTPGAGASFGILQITFFSGANGTGANLGTVATSPGNAQTSAQVNAGSPTGTWISLDTGIAQAPVGAQSFQVFTLVVDQNPTTVYFDDLNLQQVPEPSSFALMGLGGMGLVGWLRRRK